MTEQEQNRAGPYIKGVLALLGVILVVLCFALYREYRILRRLQIVQSHRSFLDALRNRGPLTAADTDAIQTWMTFDYVNRVFGLPLDYLRTKLGISDSHYPRVSLGHYAGSQHVAATVFLELVKNAVKDHPTSTAPTTRIFPVVF